MAKLVWLPFLLVLALSAPLYAKDKDSSFEKAIEDVFDDDDHPGKGKGRPDNPGEHGRENAAEKQSRGHGNGSPMDRFEAKQERVLEMLEQSSSIRSERFDDDLSGPQGSRRIWHGRG